MSADQVHPLLGSDATLAIGGPVERAAEALRAFLFDNDRYQNFIGDLVHTLPHVDIDWNGDEEVAAQNLADAENEILDALAHFIINNTGEDTNE